MKVARLNTSDFLIIILICHFNNSNNSLELLIFNFIINRVVEIIDTNNMCYKQKNLRMQLYILIIFLMLYCTYMRYIFYYIILLYTVKFV